jgi:cobalt-zinc-cadmium efflux system membrane fusion protein
MRLSFLALILVVAMGCRKDKAPDAKQEGAHRDEPEHAPMPTRVHVPPKVVADAKIRDEPARRETIATVIELPGEIAADPDRLAKVSSPVAGRLEKVSFREGSVVTRGEALAVIRVPDFAKAKADAMGTQARAAAARANATRLHELSQKGLSAAQEELAATAEADALEAQSRAASELLKAMGSGEGPINSQLTLRSPIGGTAIRRDAVVGQPVTPDQTIATVADLSEAWFLGRVFEKDLGRLTLSAKTEIVLNAFPNERFEGVLEYLGKEIDPVARTLTARVRVKNRDDHLRVGLFGTARAQITAAHDKPAQGAVLVVPRDAVIDLGGKSMVFVREPDGDYEMHQVVLGEAGLGKVQIVSGLREGEPVVVEGAFTLKAILLKKSLGEAEE